MKLLFKEFVISERTRRGMTINDFSGFTKVTTPILGRIEKGYVPTMRTIGKILTATGYTYLDAKRFIDDIQ